LINTLLLVRKVKYSCLTVNYTREPVASGGLCLFMIFAVIVFIRGVTMVDTIDISRLLQAPSPIVETAIDLSDSCL